MLCMVIWFSIIHPCSSEFFSEQRIFRTNEFSRYHLLPSKRAGWRPGPASLRCTPLLNHWISLIPSADRCKASYLLIFGGKILKIKEMLKAWTRSDPWGKASKYLISLEDSRSMAKRRGNPNWGKPEPIGPVVPTVTSFEQVVKEFKLTPDQYVRSTRLREWARRNKNSKYIPEALLEAWGFEIESTL